MINQIKSAASADYIYTQRSTKGAATAKVDDSAYSVEISNKLSADEIDKIKQQAEMANQSLRDIVEKLILKQSGISVSVEAEDIVADDAQADAQELISEEGAFGVKAVSDRIVSFAKAISGNDPAKLAELKEAIDKGFDMARESFGGTLPDICDQTYDAIMEKLDKWSAEENSSVDIVA